MQKKKLSPVRLEIIRIDTSDIITTSGEEWGVNSDKVGFGGGTSSFDAPARSRKIIWED